MGQVDLDGQIEKIAYQLGKARKFANGWQCCCPAHEDKTPSLSLSTVDDKILVHCHAGCSQEAVVQALKNRGLWYSAQLSQTIAPQAIKKNIVEAYDYVNEDNELLYQVLRYEPKSFQQRRLVNGHWVYTMGNVRRVLYRLPQVQAAILDGKPVLVVEGEKDVHTAEHMGLTATCNAMGADLGNGSKWKPEFADYLVGADVYIIADADRQGEKHAAWVFETLKKKAHSVHIIRPPAGCKDLSDWAVKGCSWSDLRHAAKLLYSEEVVARRNLFSHVGDPFEKLKPIDWLVRDYFESNSLSLIFGEPGSGKSFIALSIACSVASGTPWYDKAVKPGAVFYVCGEGHAGLLRRFAAWSKFHHVSLKNAPLYKSEHQVSMMDIDSAKHLCDDITMMKEECGVEPRLVIIDTVARNFGAGDENSTKDMSLFIEHIDQYVRIPFQCNVMLIHHSGHLAGRARGSSALRAALDAEYMVEKDDLRCTLTSTKMKDSEIPDPMYYKFKKVDLGVFNDEEVKSAVLEYVPEGLEFKVGEKYNKQPITVQDVITAVHHGYSMDLELQQMLDASPQQTSLAMLKCSERGLIKRISGDTVYSLTMKGQDLISITGALLEPQTDTRKFYGGSIDER